MIGKIGAFELGAFPQKTRDTLIVISMVSAVDPTNGNIPSFVAAKKLDPSFRLIGLTFNVKKDALHLVFFAKFELRVTTPYGDKLPMPTPWPYENTGVIWKITHTSADTMTITKTTSTRTNSGVQQLDHFERTTSTFQR